MGFVSWTPWNNDGVSVSVKTFLHEFGQLPFLALGETMTAHLPVTFHTAYDFIDISHLLPYLPFSRLKRAGSSIWKLFCTCDCLCLSFIRFGGITLRKGDPNCIASQGYRRDLYSDKVCGGQHPSLNRHVQAYTPTHTVWVEQRTANGIDQVLKITEIKWDLLGQ